MKNAPFVLSLLLYYLHYKLHVFLNIILDILKSSLQHATELARLLSTYRNSAHNPSFKCDWIMLVVVDPFAYLASVYSKRARVWLTNCISVADEKLHLCLNVIVLM